MVYRDVAFAHSNKTIEKGKSTLKQPSVTILKYFLAHFNSFITMSKGYISTYQRVLRYEVNLMTCNDSVGFK